MSPDLQQTKPIQPWGPTFWKPRLTSHEAASLSTWCQCVTLPSPETGLHLVLTTTMAQCIVSKYAG